MSFFISTNFIGGMFRTTKVQELFYACGFSREYRHNCVLRFEYKKLRTSDFGGAREGNVVDLSVSSNVGGVQNPQVHTQLLLIYVFYLHVLFDFCIREFSVMYFLISMTFNTFTEI
jgi:hypothetical protein